MPDFGYRTGTFHHQPIERTADQLAAMGYDCLELCLEAPDVRPENLDAADCAQIRASLTRAGIALASLSYHADREPAEQRRANQERAVHAAAWMNCSILILNPEKAVDQAAQWAEHVARFQHLCALADELGVTIAVEPEPLLVVASSADAARMIEQVGSPRLRVNLDIGHAFLTDDDLAASIRMLGEQIVHLHLEDMAAGVHRHLPFGAGDIDFSAVRQTLDDVGYAGPYVVDLFGQERRPEEVAAEALQGLRERFG
jgi:sugar phosphate isomerase/epimerase